jgi:uncharacterized delta-60 repeat protein
MKQFYFILFFLGISQICFAQQALDWSFNNSGTQVFDYGNQYDEAYAVAVQSDGKIIVGGHSIDVTFPYLILVRYNVDGSLDTSFSADGIFIITSGIYGPITTLLIQPDGKILFNLGESVGRIDNTGSIDLSFGSSGFAWLPFETTTLALQPDGKIIVGGKSNYYPELCRLNTDGSTDTAFSFSPLILGGVNFAGVNSIQIRPDGKILILDYYNCTFSMITTESYFIELHHTDGSIDTSFSSMGYLVTGYGGQLILHPDGKMLVSSYSYFTSPSSIYGMFRLDSLGNADTTFYGGSVLPLNYGGNVLLQPDGKYILTGTYGSNFALERYDVNGNFDGSFGLSSATVITDFGATEEASASALIPDGKIIVVGSTNVGGNYNFAVARYNANAIGITEEMNENPMNIYPNPVSNQLTVSSKTAFNNASLKLMDVSGQIVLTQQNINGYNFTLDVSPQPTGLYLVEITQNGSISRTKMVKE